MANESYESFAKTLQSEIEKEEGIKFGVIEAHAFANIPVMQADGSTAYLGQQASEKLFSFYEQKGYIEGNGKVSDKLKTALKNNTLELPLEYEPNRNTIVALSKKVSGALNIKNNADKQTVNLNKQIFLSNDFKLLWEKIKYKTTYSVDFNSVELIEKCCEEMRQNLKVESPKLIYTKALFDIEAGGIGIRENDRTAVYATNQKENLPDVLTFLQNETNLTRRTIVEILKRSQTLHLFKKNPQKYMDETARMISAKMRLSIVDGIKYTQIGAEEYYAQELFENNELFGYLSKNMIESTKSVYEYVIYDSDNEAGFAQKFENNKHIKLYAKLPDWFKIPTPLGTYNPDWALLIDKDGEQKLYFVLETKANILKETLRPTESAKIACGYKHFEALGNAVKFEEVDDFAAFIETI